jgi:hypothetical protein
LRTSECDIGWDIDRLGFLLKSGVLARMWRYTQLNFSHTLLQVWYLLKLTYHITIHDEPCSSENRRASRVTGRVEQAQKLLQPLCMQTHIQLSSQNLCCCDPVMARFISECRRMRHMVRLRASQCKQASQKRIDSEASPYLIGKRRC